MFATGFCAARRSASASSPFGAASDDSGTALAVVAEATGRGFILVLAGAAKALPPKASNSAAAKQSVRVTTIVRPLVRHGPDGDEN